MPDHPSNPTLLVGVGAFGRDVLQLTTRTATVTGSKRWGKAHNLALIEVMVGLEQPASSKPLASPVMVQVGDPLPAVALAKEALHEMLDLAHFVGSTQPTDARGPLCDVVVIADLSEPEIAGFAPLLVRRLEEDLCAEYRAVLGGGEGALVVGSMLCVPHSSDRVGVVSALRQLSSRGEGFRSRTVPARVHVVEDRSGKYLLSRSELLRSFSGFLHLLLYARLRDMEAGARHLIERGERHGACFATFACATLVFDGESLLSLCAVALAQEVLQGFRKGRDLTVAELGAEAQALLPSRASIEHDLWKEGSLGSLEQHLAPPTIDVPEVLEEDTPEGIVEHKMNSLWRASVARRIAAYREDTERFKMDRLAEEMERNGKACLERLQKQIADSVEEEVRRGPRGHARALEICHEAKARAGAELEALALEIEAPDLSPFPVSPLDERVSALEQAVFARPRAYRMVIFGVLASLLGLILVGGAIRGVLRLLAAPEVAYFDPFALLPDGLPWVLGRGPIPFVLGASLAIGSVWYRLFKHKKRHHNWVVEARDSLDQALKRYLSRDVVSYFYKRLHYGRLLWLQRIYKRLIALLEETLVGLEAVRAALAEAQTQLKQQEGRLNDCLEGGEHKGGILLRGLVTPGHARAVYKEVKPPEVVTLATRWLEVCLEAGEPSEAQNEVREKDSISWKAAPFADSTKLVAYCQKQLSELEELSPFDSHSPALRNASIEGTRAFLRQLALKLSPPLEVVEVANTSGQQLDRMMFIPSEAQSLIDKIMVEENLHGHWEIRPISGDRNRIHLVVVRGELDLSSLAIAAGEIQPPIKKDKKP